MDIDWPVPGEQVQHCNARTEYEMVVHGYAPNDCAECDRIEDDHQAGDEMTTTELNPSDTSWLNGQARPAEAPRRRLRGLRMPVIPSGTLLTQLGGGLATFTGVYLAAGLAITLIAAGVTAAVLGALREAGKI